MTDGEEAFRDFVRVADEMMREDGPYPYYASSEKRIGDMDPVTRYRTWKRGECPSCGCGRWVRGSNEMVIAEEVVICACCTSYGIDQREVGFILAQIAEGARIVREGGTADDGDGHRSE